tara:strand:- start:15379 stop:15678 length:300 start_codon:yes stop_codon:yes gene_type:complete
MKLSEFINESSIPKIKKKLQNAIKKQDSFMNKAISAEKEELFRKEQIEYEQTKERLRRERDGAPDKVEKEKSKQKLAELKKDWKPKRKKLVDSYRSLRK